MSNKDKSQYEEVFFRLTTFFSGTKKICPRNNFCSVFYVLESKKKNFGVIIKILDFFFQNP